MNPETPTVPSMPPTRGVQPAGRHAKPTTSSSGGDSLAGPEPATVQLMTQAVAARLDGAAPADPQEMRSLVAEEVDAWVHRRAHAGHTLPTVDDEGQLVDAVVAALSGLGPLQPLLDRDDVENIHIHGHDHVWLELADGGLQRWPHPVATDDAALVRILEGMFARLGQTSREFSPGQPIGNLRLPAGGPLGARLAAVMEITDRPRIAIRRHRHPNITLNNLVDYYTLDADLAAFLRAAVMAGCNIVVSGGPGAGKTTLLRALCHAIPATEHIITAEEDFELGLHLQQDRPLVTPLEARMANAEGVGELTLDDLLKQALRHSPSRVIVGEVRGGEVTAMLRALGNGAAGGMCTLHASSVAAVADRIAALAQLAQPPLPIEAAHRWTASAVDLVVHLQRRGDTERSRYVAEVAEIGDVGDADVPDLTSLFATRTAWPGSPARPVCPPGSDLLRRLQAVGMSEGLFGDISTWTMPRPTDRGPA